MSDATDSPSGVTISPAKPCAIEGIALATSSMPSLTISTECRALLAPAVAQAQTDKLEHICRKLRLKPGDRLLDIGCGWGALAIRAARRGRRDRLHCPQHPRTDGRFDLDRSGSRGVG